MSTFGLSEIFNDRLSEIEDYLDFVNGIEEQVQRGTPRLGANGPIISATQQRILYSSVFLQLYNLVEATVTRCINAVADAASKSGRWRPHDLCTNLRREWVRYHARTHIDLNYENRLIDAVALCDNLITRLPIKDLKIHKGGGGNWDDTEIEDFMVNRLGLTLNYTHETLSLAKRHVRDDKGALKLIKKLRNDLAHGSTSFAECGNEITANELREIANRTISYLRETVEQFVEYISQHMFLAPDSRPPPDAK